MMNTQVERIADRLEVARSGRFVGRAAELELFRSALGADVPSFVVLHVHGAGGVGKTTLLHEYARLAAVADRPVFRLDARTIEPTPPGFLRGLGQVVRPQAAEPYDPTCGWPSRGVLLLDTYELLAPLDAWLRDAFLPKLPRHALVVIAGRNPPAAEWRSDPAWATLTRVVALRDLDDAECQSYLAGRNVSDHQRAQLVRLTRGRPLALALLVDLLPQEGPEPLRLEEHPDAVHALLQRLLDHVPSALHRRTLAVAAIARTTTERLLVELFDERDAPMLFDWLRSLSFMEHGRHGLFPHDVVRDLLDTDFRWRNLEWYRELHQRVLAHLHERFLQGPPSDRPHLRAETMFVYRHDPSMQPFFAWEALGQAYAEPATSGDAEVILSMVRQHEGEASTRIARHWLERQPNAFQIFRALDGSPAGFMANLQVNTLPADDLAADPAMAAARSFMQQHGPVRSSEEVVYLRFLIHREVYQDVSPAINVAADFSVTYWLTRPALAWNFIAMANADFFRPHFDGINIRRAPDADFEVDGRRYGVFAHDWRVEPPTAWLAWRRSMFWLPKDDESRDLARAPVFTPDTFAAAVLDALRNYTRPMLLAANPLNRTWLVERAPRETSDVSNLQRLLHDAVASLNANPKERKLHRALWYTYIEPLATQERAAEHLSIPFSTYRYQLTKGVERVAEGLWRRYTGDRPRRST